MQKKSKFLEQCSAVHMIKEQEIDRHLQKQYRHMKYK